MNIFGYFDNPNQTEPSFDPGLGVNCPHCQKPLDEEPERQTISLRWSGDARSYFYRVHKACREAASLEERYGIESLIVDKPLGRA